MDLVLGRETVMASITCWTMMGPGEGGPVSETGSAKIDFTRGWTKKVLAIQKQRKPDTRGIGARKKMRATHRGGLAEVALSEEGEEGEEGEEEVEEGEEGELPAAEEDFAKEGATAEG